MEHLGGQPPPAALPDRLWTPICLDGTTPLRIRMADARSIIAEHFGTRAAPPQRARFTCALAGEIAIRVVTDDGTVLNAHESRDRPWSEHGGAFAIPDKAEYLEVQYATGGPNEYGRIAEPTLVLMAMVQQNTTTTGVDRTPRPLYPGEREWPPRSWSGEGAGDA